jgi:hypothetical protein
MDGSKFVRQCLVSMAEYYCMTKPCKTLDALIALHRENVVSPIRLLLQAVVKFLTIPTISPRQSISYLRLFLYSLLVLYSMTSWKFVFPISVWNSEIDSYLSPIHLRQEMIYTITTRSINKQTVFQSSSENREHTHINIMILRRWEQWSGILTNSAMAGSRDSRRNIHRRRLLHRFSL